MHLQASPAHGLFWWCGSQQPVHISVVPYLCPVRHLAPCAAARHSAAPAAPCWCWSPLRPANPHQRCPSRSSACPLWTHRQHRLIGELCVCLCADDLSYCEMNGLCWDVCSLWPEISLDSFLSAESTELELQSAFPLRTSALSSPTVPPLPRTTWAAIYTRERTLCLLHGQTRKKSDHKNKVKIKVTKWISSFNMTFPLHILFIKLCSYSAYHSDTSHITAV